MLFIRVFYWTLLPYISGFLLLICYWDTSVASRNTLTLVLRWAWQLGLALGVLLAAPSAKPAKLHVRTISKCMPM